MAHKWTEEDEIIALDAYLSTLEGVSVSDANRKGVDLINRRSQRDGVRGLEGTPIRMKLKNIQYLDTDGQEGLSGCSGLCMQVFGQYRNAPEELEERMAEIKESLEEISSENGESAKSHAIHGGLHIGASVANSNAPDIVLENKIEKHTKEIAIMLADMAYFIPPEVVEYVAQKNKKQYDEIKGLLGERIDVSEYLFDRETESACVFPGLRRPHSKINKRNGKFKYNKEARAIQDGNETPRHIWCWLLKNKAYTGPLWAKTEFSQFELAHILPHKEDDESLALVQKLFQKVGNPRAFFSHFSGAGNAVLLPKGSVRPTDTLEEIKTIFIGQYIELYGEAYLGEMEGFQRELLPNWFDELSWNKIQLPNDWRSRIDSLINYRTNFIKTKLSNSS